MFSMGSESDIEELHTSILSLCEEDSQVKLLNQTLNLSPIKSNEGTLTDTPSHASSGEGKCSSTDFTPSLVLKSDTKFSTRAHSTPMLPKRLCSSTATLEIEQETITEEDGNKDLYEMSTYEGLLSEVSILCGLPQNHLLCSEGPPKLKMEDSVKNLNQTQLSKIDIDSILFESSVQNDKLKMTEAPAAETSECQEKTPGRFAGLCSTISASSVLEEEENVELSEDILGLDEYIYSELDSDDYIDEETLLSGEDTVLHDKTLNHDSGVEFVKKGAELPIPDPDSTLKIDDSSSEEDTVLESNSDDENNHNSKPTSESETSNVETKFLDVNANTDSLCRKRKDSAAGLESEKLLKKAKFEDGVLSTISEKNSEEFKENTQSDVEYVVISLLGDSESDIDAKSDDDNVDADLKKSKIQTSVSSKVKIPTMCVSPLIKQDEKDCENERNSQEQQSKENYNTEIDYRKERSFLKNENDLTRNVMRKWKSSGIHNPEKNLTCASTFRKKNTDIKGRLEGFHLSTLHGDANEKGIYVNSRATRSLTDSINKLKNDMHEYEQYHYARLQEMKMKFYAMMDQESSRNKNRIRCLRVQQEMEVRSVYFQHIDPMFKQCQLMQLKEDHQTQMGHVQCVALNEEQAISNEYLDKVEMERRKFEEQYHKMASLVEQLGQGEFEEKDEQFGPHVVVNFVKAPCRNNHERKSQVSVCLPLDIANSLLKEDELYDRFYEY